MTCGKPSHIRKWFGPCVLSYGHGGACEHPPLEALHESDGRCSKCGNDRAAWDRAIAEIARLTAELAAAREAAQRDRDVAQAMAKAAHEAEDALAAARAVPGDVEAAIEAFDDACDAVGMYTAGPKDLTAKIRLYKDHDDARDRLRTAIARAISDATADNTRQLHETWPATAAARPTAAAVPRCSDAGSGTGVCVSCSTMHAVPATPPTVGSLLATAPVARPLSEWHEDHGDVLWWVFPIDEPPYCGSPLDDNWPDYHTHWTPIVCPDEPNQRGPLPKGG